jgi:hypothetical protein
VNADAPGTGGTRGETSAATHDNNAILTSGSVAVGRLKVYVVLALTPKGQERRKCYLSPGRAKDRAHEWAARGWAVVTVTAIASPTRIEQVAG